ncbi:MAG: DNA polymerase IV [Alphaproteobacteria bacterium]|nr:MAG: DNA polymerase IV [Alphaproteobacteria bacterium]
MGDDDLPGLGWLCRACGTSGTGKRAPNRCPVCAAPRIVAHPELHSLSIAHIDCDAFFATVEKLGRPDLTHRPVIVGGGHRGVVAACCYVARQFGVRSAMPMFKALERCPDAVVIRPDHGRYAAVGRRVKALMRTVTPLVESVSIDEAYLDLSDHPAGAARVLAQLALMIERDIGITVSIGLSYGKFLAKMASDLDKPRGFAVIGRAEAAGFLAPRPVGAIHGVGAALARRLEADGMRIIADLQAADPRTLIRDYGAMGAQLAAQAHGEDRRRVVPSRPLKSLSAETTFSEPTTDPQVLRETLAGLARRLGPRLAASGKVASTAVLKLKTAGFDTRTRHRALDRPTNAIGPILSAAEALLIEAADGTAFRLIGIGAEALRPLAEVEADLIDGLTAPAHHQ